MEHVIHPPHVLARFQRRRIGFIGDMERRGFTVTSNCAYLKLIDGLSYIVMSNPSRLGVGGPSSWIGDRSHRYWPNWCRIYRLVGHDGGISNFSLLGSGILNKGELDLPELREAEADAHEVHKRRHIFRGTATFQPWKTIVSGMMRGPPHFDDFLLEWNSPLSLLMDEGDKKAGWARRWIP